jgi:hypothetical protein
MAGVKGFPMLCRLVLFLLILTPPALAQAVPTQGVLGLFNSAQELPVFTPEQLEARRAMFGNDPEAVAADQALNDWKECVADALVRWSALKPGVGLMIDGAYGRCADLERQYRDHLMRITQGSRVVVDAQLARSLTRLLEDTWRPRLSAMALDDQLLHQPAAPPATPVPALPSENGSARRPGIRPRA